MPNAAKTVLVLCKAMAQLLVSEKTQKSQTEPGCETPSALRSPWVSILMLADRRCLYMSFFGLPLVSIIRKQGMGE